MCKATPSLPTATDLPGSLVNPEPPKMDGHLFVDIFTLCFVVAVVLLYLVLKTWQRKKAAAAAAAAEAAAAAAAALSVQTEGTQTDSSLFNIDDTLNRAHGTRTCIKRKKITYGKFFDFCAEKCVYN